MKGVYLKVRSERWKQLDAEELTLDSSTIKYCGRY